MNRAPGTTNEHVTMPNAHACKDWIDPEGAELVIRAARGERVTLSAELARSILLASNDQETARALGLDRSTRTRIRDRALIEAAHWLSTDGCTSWQAARRLAMAVRRFEYSLLSHLRNGAQIELTPSERALWRAYQAGAPRQLRDVSKLYDLLKLAK